MTTELTITETPEEMNETQGEVVVRKTIYDVLEIRRQILAEYVQMRKTDKAIGELFKEINGYEFYEFRQRGCNTAEKEIDQRCWQYFVRIYQLEKYMLCTEYAKLRKQIENYELPEFNLENAEAWMLSLKGMVYENVQKLIEDVFNRITQGTYYTGSGYNNSVKKKRNNNGIDKWFILRTYDINGVNWYSCNPTITDDLEKACYIIDGQLLPESTIKERMRRGKILEAENPYFWIRVCKNGNTQYKMKDKIREKLNLYGSKKGVIGENVRIKIFDKKEDW